MGGNRPILLELLIGSVSGDRVIESQHKRMRETVSLAGSLGATNICHLSGQVQLRNAYEDV